MRAFRDGVLRGVKKIFNPDPVEPMEERAAALLARFPVSEDGKFALVNACEAFLAEFRGCAQPSGELRFRAARLLAHLRRHDEAIAVLDAIAPNEVDAADRALYRAELSYLAGDLEAAERHFAGLDRLQLQVRPSWKRSLARFEKHKRALQGKRRALDLYASLARAEGPDLAPLQALLADDGLDEAQGTYYRFIHDRVAHIAALAPRESAAPAPLPDVRPVFACGFGWSGSGAVSAFLSQSTEVVLPFGHSEMAHLQGRNRVRGIKPFLKPRKLAPEGMRMLLVEFACRSVGTFGDSKDTYSLYPYYPEPAQRAALGAAMDAFASEMLGQACLQDRDARATAVARFVLQSIAILSPGQRPVLNNVFMAGNVALARYMPAATFVIVKRDLRDQYIARKLEGKAAYGRPVTEFAEMIQRAWGKYVRNAKAGDAWLPNIVEVQFEEFVREPACRSRLLDVLGIAAGSIAVDKSKFDPEVSGKNAGIHESYARSDEIRILDDLATHFEYSKKGVVTL